MKRKVSGGDDTKQTVNYGTGSGTCEKCGDNIAKGVLRIGKFHLNCSNGRYGEAGGHMKYSHVECFRAKPLVCEGRASKWMSSVKTRYEGFEALSSRDQQRIIALAQKGRIPSKAAEEAWAFLLCFHKYQKTIFTNLPIDCAYIIAEFICGQKCPKLHTKKEIRETKKARKNISKKKKRS